MTGTKKFFFTFFFSIVFCNGFAQEDSLTFKMLSPMQLRSFGKSAMQQGDYEAAAKYYERFMELRPENYFAAYVTAEAHRLNRNYEPALKWYEKSYELSKNTLGIALYYQGLMLKMNNECDKAKEKFLAFRKQAGSDKESQALKRQIKNEIMGCDSVQLKPASTKVVITHLDTTVNKPHIESAPLYLNDCTIIYSALRSNKREYIIANDTNKAPVRKLYAASKANDEWKYSGEFTGPFNAPDMDVTAGTFTPDGKRFYFTRCARNWQYKMICAIYLSENINGVWSEPVKLDKTINHPMFTSTQPTVAVSQKGLEIVYFVSDRKGSKGGYDIWYFTYNPARNLYSPPKTAGTKINTTGDEMAPYYDQETGTLYFSSTGWPGMGGFDIFKSTGQMRKFTLPENLQAPVNSTYDDLYYTISKNRERGMLVSNRSESVCIRNPNCCDDLFEFQRLEFVELLVEGTISGGKDSLSKIPLKDAKVAVYLIDQASGEPMFTKYVTTDEEGNFSFPVEAGNKYKIVAEKEGHFNAPASITTVGITESQTLRQDFFVKEVPREALKLERVHYETNKHELTEESKGVLDSTLVMLLIENPEIKVEIGAHTDDVGSDAYNKTLSQKRAEGVVKYLEGKGIQPERLVAVGYGESKPIASNINPDGTPNPEGREMNRRTEFRIIGKVENLDIIDNSMEEEEAEEVIEE